MKDLRAAKQMLVMRILESEQYFEPIANILWRRFISGLALIEQTDIHPISYLRLTKEQSPVVEFEQVCVDKVSYASAIGDLMDVIVFYQVDNCTCCGICQYSVGL